MQEWDPKLVGEVLQEARLKQGLSLNEMYRRTGVKSQTISRIERGLTTVPPRKRTQAKLEEALGIKLPLPDDASRTISVYIAPEQICYLEEVIGAFPGETLSHAVMGALKDWSEHRAVLAKWYGEHDVNLQKEIERMAMKHAHIHPRKVMFESDTNQGG